VLSSVAEPLHPLLPSGLPALSKDVDLRAECFIARSTPVYAIFEAIVYPKVFTLELYKVGRRFFGSSNPQ
jgi:hypothetical protein